MPPSSNGHVHVDAQPAAECQRQLDARANNAPWWRWGPYLSERQWGTVRKGYSAGAKPGTPFRTTTLDRAPIVGARTACSASATTTADCVFASRLGRSLALSLEFLLGADILRTAVEPSWDKIGRLAAIAAIRTALNYFLQREIAEDARMLGRDPEIMREVLASPPMHAQTRPAL
jgi:hypothetical protein